MSQNSIYNRCIPALQDALANLVDLEEVVLNWAKLIFDTTKSKAEAKIKKKYLAVSQLR